MPAPSHVRYPHADPALRDAPSARFNEPYPDQFRDALGIQHLVAGAVSLVPHREPRLLHAPSVDEKANDDGGIGIRPVETSAVEHPPSGFTHEIDGHRVRHSLFEVSEDRSLE